jgi:adenosylcobinamide-GDP ribazoletransferase
MLEMFFMQIQFLTRIPLPVKIKFDEKKFAKSMIFSPVIGLLIGLILGGVYYLAQMTGKQLFAVVMVITAEVIITGGLHLDGLADTFDGIFSNRPKNKILTIMKDSRIGTNGTIALILVMLCKAVLLASINNVRLVFFLFALPAISRMNIVWTAGTSPSAAKDGMGKSVVKYTGVKEIIAATLITCVISAVFLKWAAFAVVPAAIVFALLFCVYVKRKIGGITGDIIGAVIELTEIVVLFVLFLWK